MKLFHSPASPYVRKVMITAHELGLTDELELVAAASSPLDPNADVVAQNPVGKIPALILGDGTVLTDSRVICRFLNHHAEGTLYASGDREFPIIAREAVAEGMIDAALLIVYEGRLRPEELRFDPWVEGQKKKILEGCKRMNDRVGELSGPVTIDKIALGAALGYFDFRMPDLGWRDGNAGLADWYGEFAKRDSMVATEPKG